MKKSFWKNKRVLITGSTGFKGTWLTHLLNKLNCKVYGYSLLNNTERYYFYNKTIKKKINFKKNNVINLSEIKKTINKIKPDIIFHLAAQPIVSLSYQYDLNTIQSNIIGTANILHSLKEYKKQISVVFITTDKVYKNSLKKKIINYFNEDDELGGDDIYSASKASCEFLISSYQQSFFKNTNIKIVSARAGNVIGGGDFSKDRIIPDIVKSQKQKKIVMIRNPNHIRPWQHVLDVLHGYLLLAEKIHSKKNFDLSWNFSPHKKTIKTVGDLVLEYNKHTKNILNFEIINENLINEKPILLLDSNKARKILNWTDKLSFQETIKLTSSWYDSYLNNENLNLITDKQINYFLKLK